jgi:hypothetical protein|tara:strand:+ start:226 stop:1269 length:1044 start_codon:yes stop_codon:yes gene_type:complete
MAIHTIGCSFTNYIYPTWADYIQNYYSADLVNLGYPAQGNDTIKKHLYTIDDSDHVIIMFTSYDRITIGIDSKFLKQKKYYEKNFDKMVSLEKNNFFYQKKYWEKDLDKILDSIKNTDQHFFRNDEPFTSFTPFYNVDGFDKLFSQFHKMYNFLENIYDCQNYLESRKIDYTFCLWQGFYNDMSVIRSSNQPKINCSPFMENKIYKAVWNRINKHKFVQDFDKGLWEYMVSSKELVLAQSSVDPHPSSLCHYNFFKQHLKPILDEKKMFRSKLNLAELEHRARKFSEWYCRLDRQELTKMYWVEQKRYTRKGTSKSELVSDYERDKKLQEAKDYYFKKWENLGPYQY